MQPGKRRQELGQRRLRRLPSAGFAQIAAPREARRRCWPKVASRRISAALAAPSGSSSSSSSNNNNNNSAARYHSRPQASQMSAARYNYTSSSSFGICATQRNYTDTAVTIGQQQQQHDKQQHSQQLAGPVASRWVASSCSLSAGASVGRADLTEMDTIKLASRAHRWHWNSQDKSHECVVSDNQLEVCFHPECSESAAAIRGSEPLLRNGNYYYWEVTVLDKTYGTSVMFGLCTKQQRLHANDYCNLIGLDKEGWSLSHKGLIWHDKKTAQFTHFFPPNQSITLGLLFNTMRGELSYFMNGKNLGVAFCGLNDVPEELYPVIGSTAKCTRMRLDGAYCGYASLMERSCFTILKHAPKNRIELVKKLHLQKVPLNLITYLAQVAEVCGSQTKNTTSYNQYKWNINRLVKGEEDGETSYPTQAPH